MKTPIAIETGIESASASSARIKVSSMRLTTPWITGWPLTGEIPQFPVTKCPSQVTYCSSTGRFRPYFCRKSWSSCGEASFPSVRRATSTPIALVATNVTSEIAKIVKTRGSR